MAVKLRVLSGDEVVGILGEFGFVVHSQKGSHIKLKRTVNEHAEIVVVPLRNPIPTGTLKAIFNQASRFISTEELRRHFYR